MLITHIGNKLDDMFEVCYSKLFLNVVAKTT